MEQKTIGDLPVDVQPIAIEVERIRTSNAKIVEEIEAQGAEIDLVTARLEHVMNSLVELGVITEKQMWEMQLDWEKALAAQIKPIRERFRAAVREAQIEARKPKLIVPGRP